MMKSITHEKVQEILRSGQKPSEIDQETFAIHLSQCQECQSYAAIIKEFGQVVPQIYASPSLPATKIRQKAQSSKNLLWRKSMFRRFTHGTTMFVWLSASLVVLLVLVFTIPQLLPEQTSGVPGSAVFLSTTPSPPIITATALQTETLPTKTIPAPTKTVAPSLTPTETITPSPTLPPAGVFAIKFYPPLVLDYPTDQWVDKSEYENTEMIVNYLQNQELKTCTIGPMGASGFYPENMEETTLGGIQYQYVHDQTNNTGNVNSYYFALSSLNGSIESEAGIPHFYVQSSPTEAKNCKAAAEEVLSTLRRAD